MNNNANALKDTRLLEALEFIDDSYVADVFACIKVPDVTAAPAGGKGKILRSLKYVAAVAACALLMSTLIPVVQYVTGNLSSFLPSGWLGEVTTEDTNQYRQNAKCNYNPIHILLAPFGKTAAFRFFVGKTIIGLNTLWVFVFFVF